MNLTGPSLDISVGFFDTTNHWSRIVANKFVIAFVLIFLNLMLLWRSIILLLAPTVDNGLIFEKWILFIIPWIHNDCHTVCIYEFTIYILALCVLSFFKIVLVDLELFGNWSTSNEMEIANSNLLMVDAKQCWT